jgi:hypothetical protein
MDSPPGEWQQGQQIITTRQVSTDLVDEDPPISTKI